MTGTATLAQSAALAFLGCALSLWLLLRTGLARRMLDVPNLRSLHRTAVPRAGGVAIAVGVAAAALASWTEVPAALRSALVSALALAVVSWVDDVRGLPALPRLVAHLSVAALWAWSIGIAGIWLPLAVLGIGWSTNLYNFMDGADGIAGGMAVIGFGAYAAAFATAGATGPAAVCVAVAAAALAFLLWNSPPARVFMGDSGSIPLGFLAAVLGIEGCRTQGWPVAFPLLVFMPFWFDATLTLALRVARGSRPWEAHRDHFYQKAVRSGLGHRATAHGAWLLMASCGVLAFASLGRPGIAQALLSCTALAICSGSALAVERRLRKNSST